MSSVNPPSKLLVYSLAIAMLLCSYGFAQGTKTESSTKDTQLWYGVLDAGIKLRMQIEINTNADGTLTGKAISLDQGNAVLPFDELTLDDQEFSFFMKSVGARFSGKLNENRTVATGTFKQGLGSFPFEIKKVDKIPTRKHLESWTGKMKAGFVEFDFQFRVFENEDGKRTAALDSFTENIEGLSCDWIQEDADVTINIAAAKAKFIGVLDSETNEIKGDWNQGGNEFPLTLKKIPLASTRLMKVNRPQTPKPPFDYDATEVSIENKDADVTLAGTLTSPHGDGPFPVVVLISGSGPQDRDETLFEHKPFFVIADHFANQGFAVLRYDDRGTAKSTGDFSSATSADFATDVGAIVDFLRTQSKVDKKRIILCGHSEGGIIGPMVAASRNDIAGVIMMAGPGVNGRRIALNQSRLLAAAAGADETSIKVNDELLNRIFAAQDAGQPLDDSFLDKFLDHVKTMLSEDELKNYNAETSKSAIKMAVDRTETPWFKFFATYDPSNALEKLKCPVLALVGEKDLQVDPKLNNPEIKKALESAGNEDFTIMVLPELNHLFQKCETGAVSEYQSIEQTMDESALKTMTQWLKQRFQ